MSISNQTLCKFGWHIWGRWKFNATRCEDTMMRVAWPVSVFVRTCTHCGRPERMTTRPIDPEAANG